MKTGSSLIDFDGTFPMQSSEFIKLPNFGSNLKETAKKTTFFYLNLNIDILI